MADDRQNFIDYTFIKLMRLFCEFDIALATDDDVLKDRLISEFITLRSAWEASGIEQEDKL